ncbi:MAG: YdcF family protein [Gammaproteobacteria bacterium]|nr:YdcF family protein [Gammaproteobacteria bacterium]
MEKLISFTLESLLLPPGGLLLLLITGLLLLKFNRRSGYTVLVAGVVMFYLFSAPFVSSALMGQLETSAALPPSGDLHPDPHAAIVILAGGRHKNAPEYGGDTMSAITLERVRYGARLAHRIHLPVLVTGGTVWTQRISEGALMKISLEEDLNTPVRWVEGQSRTTWENARYTKDILAKEGITRIYLVTHAWHMPRSEFAFRHFGFEIIPAPTSFSNTSELDPDTFTWFPEARALRDSYFALHERLGLLWYRVKAAQE